MSIKNIPNQPIQFEVTENGFCQVDNHNCTIYSKDDHFAYTQFKLNPCRNDLEIKEYNIDGDWQFNVGTGLISHTTTTGTGEVQFTYDLAPTGFNYFSVTLTFTNIITGYCSVLFGTELIGIVNQNGTYTFYYPYITSGDILHIVPHNDFAGSILFPPIVDAYNIPTNIVDWITVKDLDGNVIVGYEDFIGVIPKDNFITLEINLQRMDVGCYTITICDECITQLPIEKKIAWLSSNWIGSNNCDDFGCLYQPNVFYNNRYFQINTSGHSENKISYGFIANVGSLEYRDCCYRLKIPVLNVPVTGATMYIKTDVCEERTFELYPYTSYIFVDCCSEFTQVQINFDYVETSNNIESFTFGQLEIIPFANCAGEIQCYQSNCFQVIDYNETNGTKMIEGICNDYEYQLGFYWNGVFKLKQRLNVAKFAPAYNIESKDYIFSNGDQKITSAQRSKFYDIIFSSLEEFQHDSLSVQTLCKKFTIDGTEYFIKPEDYKPEWSKSSGYNKADVRLMGMKQGTIIFRENQN